ncbi:unnamed protein product [Scytosiphon promiscuus]
MSFFLCGPRWKQHAPRTLRKGMPTHVHQTKLPPARVIAVPPVVVADFHIDFLEPSCCRRFTVSTAEADRRRRCCCCCCFCRFCAGLLIEVSSATKTEQSVREAASSACGKYHRRS